MQYKKPIIFQLNGGIMSLPLRLQILFWSESNRAIHKELNDTKFYDV